MERYVVLEKREGETPLECLEAWRTAHGVPSSLPLAYAGRLDPMASGKLLVLIGEECKVQTKYHAFDKEYRVQVLLGVASDTGDILGLVRAADSLPTAPSAAGVVAVCKKFRQTLTLPYPLYSSKPVAGKPLHAWASEGRVSEITIPTYEATIYRLKCIGLPTTIARKDLCAEALRRIELPTSTVHDDAKKIGNDFRRTDVRAAWETIARGGHPDDTFYLITLSCTASAGMYMRTLSELIARELGTVGLAYRISRTNIGRYTPLWGNFGVWLQRL